MINFYPFLEHLSQKLEQALPGSKAHELLMPEERKAMLKVKPDINKAKKAGVLLLFYPDNDQAQIVFIERSKYEGVHSGQIAFPGGQFEKGDYDLQSTALRETEEEIGIRSETIKVLGTLTEIYIPPSNFLVLPLIGYIDYKPNFIPEKTEVENVITFPVETFFEKDIIKPHAVQIDGKLSVNVPCFKIDGHIIWGATSMILSEMLSVLKST